MTDVKSHVNKARALNVFLQTDPPVGSLIKLGQEVYAIVGVEGLRKEIRRKATKIANLHNGQPVPSLQPLYNEYVKTRKVLSEDDSAGILMLYAVEHPGGETVGNSLEDWVKWTQQA